MTDTRSLFQLVAYHHDELGHLYRRLAAEVPTSEPGDPPPPPPPPPPPGDGYSFVSDSEGWTMEGVEENWDGPIMVPEIEFAGTLREAQINLQVQIGPNGMGSTFFEFYKDLKKWKGDTILLLNRGGHGALAVSHTLNGPESEPVREPMLLAPGMIVNLTAKLHAGAWLVSFDTGARAGYQGQLDHGFVAMASPPIVVKSRLGIQLGSHGDSAHKTNAGCRLLKFDAWVK